MERAVNKKDLFLFMLFSSIYFFTFTYKAFNNYFFFDDLDSLSWIHVYPIYLFIIETFDFSYFQSSYFYRPSGSFLHGVCFKLFGKLESKKHTITQ